VTKFFSEYFDKLYVKNKAEQDAFLLMSMKCDTPKRKRPRQDSERKRPTQSQYYVPKVGDGSRVRVCSETFLSVTCVSRFRLNRLAHHFMTDGGTPKERRGGSHISIQKY